MTSGSRPDEQGEKPEMREETCEARTSPERQVVKTVCARELLGARGLLLIEHEGECYTLRLTRNNRLILTK